MPHVRLRTPSRLHLGIFSDHRPGGRCYQGLGLMIDEPGFDIEFTVTKSETVVTGISEWIQPAKSYLNQFRNLFDLPLDIKIHRAIPAHTGLGSGTQFAYVMLHGLNLLAGEVTYDIDAFRHQTQRSKRSSIGSQGYFHGGFLVDQGHDLTTGEIWNPLRLELPASWRVLLIQPQQVQGLYGVKEQEAFKQWPKFNADVLDRLLELSNEVIPEAISSHNFETFSASITEFGQLIGKSFAQFQGGIFSYPQASRIEEFVQHLGYPGLLQSSWGSTLCLFVENMNQGEFLVEQLHSSGLTVGCLLQLVSPNSTGVMYEN